ncbi:DUF167 domain-containing protein [Ilumatobacter sp.]|uniref:DUF167 domain-containing protein n=1 Tax=Ilumatobacter sp. TaxID=1967498 RepID=UPI003B517563
MAEVSWWNRTDRGIELQVRANPGASRSGLIDVGPDHVRVRLRARAVEGAANAELISFVSDLCEVRRHAVSIRRGHRSRIKTVAVVGIEAPPVVLLARSLDGS